MNSPTTPPPVPTPLAIRVYPEPRTAKKPRTLEKFPRPETMLVFDTETRTNATQALMFGCYRFIDRGRCVEEGLFFAEDLSTEELSTLQAYANSHRADSQSREKLQLLPLKEFLKLFYKAAYKTRSMVVGFNLPFDLSRLCFEVSNARREFGGGFSLGLWTYKGKDGVERLDPNRPRITIKHMDAKRALISFTGRRLPDPADLLPENFSDGKPQRGYKFRGHFLDLRTLSFALTDRGHSLKSACEAFGVERGKVTAAEHGKVTAEYITYCRRDVEATAELADRLLAEYDLHPISLPATKAFSPASIGKAYLREMGIAPILQRQPELVSHVGFAQSAFFGGRTSAHIRRVPVPVVYTDFLSMYPTVNSLMDLWSVVVAKDIRIVDHCQDEVRALLESITVEDLFRPDTWKRMRVFVRVLPDGDTLPTRGQYNSVSNDWQVAVNYLYAASPEDSLWFTLPDVVVSVLLTGQVPKIIDAFEVGFSEGALPGLRAVKLRGSIEIDPRSQDFFRLVIEERKRLSRNDKLSDTERHRLDKTLKVLANSTSYGIYGQMDRRDAKEPVSVTCRGRDAEPYESKVEHPEEPGEFCFPILASLITGGARLMLGLLEKCVTDLRGTYAMEDTDSMAIVATARGGLIPCPGGDRVTSTGESAVQELSWAQVRGIAKRFESLNPYDRDAISGSVLKIEDCNFDPKTKRQREIQCLAISAKRYALFMKGNNGSPALLRKGVNSDDNHWSEHGLGHLLNPTDPHSDDREWIAKIWESIIAKCCGFPPAPVPFVDVPAVGRVTVTSPGILKPLSTLNKGKPYAGQLKPFNFLLTCHIRPFGHPFGTDPNRFHLIAPFEMNPNQWLRHPWIDQYSGKQFQISTIHESASRRTSSVKTIGELLADYATHPESKCDGEGGIQCDRQTVGRLSRRHVRIGEVIQIGKESNLIDYAEAGIAHSVEVAYQVYRSSAASEWLAVGPPAINRLSLRALIEATGLSRRMLINARSGRVVPHPRNQRVILNVCKTLP